MNRLSVVLVTVLAIGVIAYVAQQFNVAQHALPSLANNEAATNQPLTRTENETQGTASVPSAPTDGVLDDALSDTPFGTTEEAETDLLTLEGFDANRLRLYLTRSDMPVAEREDYLTRLEIAFGDAEAMSQILQELRNDLQSG